MFRNTFTSSICSYVLDYLRDGSLVLPECFRERERLKREAEKYGLPGLIDAISGEARARPPGVITVGYRGSFQFGKDGLADVKFRKLSRILVSLFFRIKNLKTVIMYKMYNY